MGDGGIAKALAATGQSYFEVREIDYAEVLRERSGEDGAAWDRIIEFCLQGDSDGSIDERALEGVIAALDSGERFGELIERIQSASGGGVGARAAALLGLVYKALEVMKERQQDANLVLQTIADSAAHMTPDMMLAVLQQARQQTETGEPPLAAGIVERIGDDTIAMFVSESVVAERGATERLALAFEALVRDAGRKERLLDLARTNAEQTDLGSDSGFEDLWKGASNMLMSYSDKSFVSEEYGLELSGTRTHAIEVERGSDDPPERIPTWLATVSNGALRALDLALIHDLLRIENEPAAWQAIAAAGGGEVDRPHPAGDSLTAQALLDAMVAERADVGLAALRPIAETVLNTLAA